MRSPYDAQLKPLKSPAGWCAVVHKVMLVTPAHQIRTPQVSNDSQSVSYQKTSSFKCSYEVEPFAKIPSQQASNELQGLLLVFRRDLSSPGPSLDLREVLGFRASGSLGFRAHMSSFRTIFLIHVWSGQVLAQIWLT